MVKSLVSKLSSSSSLASSTSSQHEVHNPKNRNDPGRFFGDGVQFKAKLIGILEVGEARGDRMCQEALQDLKMAIRAAGEHKQRITIHVTIDGLRLRDEKTSDSLYHHPVHKISFIAQDMTDSRAFGYIFGSPDSGHRFFGIKTDKAASQVVLAMRDLFQVVFELKKKEIELARQQIQSKTIHEHQPLTLLVKNASASDAMSILSGSSSNKMNNLDGAKSSHVKEMSPESVADLVDLEQELSSIQRGITQMERITPNDPTPTVKDLTDEDPFGDSFASFPTYNLLPPPESTRSRHSKPNKPPESIVSSTTTTSGILSISNKLSSQSPKQNQINASSLSSTTDNWLNDLDQNDVFDTTKTASVVAGSTSTPIPMPSTAIMSSLAVTTAAANTYHTSPPSSSANTGGIRTKNSSPPSVPVANSAAPQNDESQLSDLDPLGTGRIRPYVDKKYFFQELKNPPKKVLKDLSAAETAGFTAQFVSSSDGSNDVLIDDAPAGSADAELNQTTDRQTSSLNSQSCTPKALNLNFTHNFTKADNQPTDPVMLPRDTDPFSPTRKKSDPFQDGDIFGKLDPFEFEFPSSNAAVGLLAETKINTVEAKKGNVFNGPLQVHLPPESGWSAANANQLQQHRRVEGQTSESPTAGVRNRPSVFKQNTVDVISSISSKKMPHLFGQKFSKRDSNSINMRRLQESDSLSENEAAPEPPPRPDSASHAEPPPLPPKKQFSDIIIRPRITAPPTSRYECVSSTNKGRNTSMHDASVPPIPLPSRRIGRSEVPYPGPGRPRKPGIDEDDYLQPMPGSVPPLLPPPQTRGRLRRQEIYENKTEAITEQLAPVKPSDDDTEEASILPDITLSQLLTLGIDELAAKLSVPTSKLSTMTLVELTTYLSEFIEKSKKPKHKVEVAAAAPSPPIPKDNPPIFKVNFDQMPDATFVAKFDDNFGEEEPMPFVANFSQYGIGGTSAAVPSTADDTSKAAPVPPADRYAVFREIMDQELHQDIIDQKSSPEADDEAESLHGPVPETTTLAQFSDDDKSPTTVPVPKIDPKITEAISHAKDRYAALRDIILVEDLFDKPPPTQSEDLLQDFPEFCDDFNSNTGDIALDDSQKSPVESSPESNQNEEEDDQASSKKDSNKFLHTLTVSSTTKDDLEIDELMNRAVSNLSLDSRDHLSPNNAAVTSPAAMENNGGSPNAMRRSPLAASKPSQFNDMSTSPIPMQKSPAPVQKSPLSKSPLSKSPIPPQLVAVSNLLDASKGLNSGSLSDVVYGSSPDADAGLSDAPATKGIADGKSPKSPKESWAVFERGTNMDGGKQRLKSPIVALTAKEQGESPCSSDGKEDWNRTGGEEYSKRWPKGQTSSSSRDLSPWDDEASDYKKRIPSAVVGSADRHGYYMRHARRMNSCDEDYEYEEEMNNRRERKIKPGISRSREKFEFDSPQWYHTGHHHTWSPQDEEGRARSFDRGAYERTTYGPPVFDKREHKIPSSHVPYDRRDYKGYDKRKYYREYMRPNYDFESYGESPDTKDRNKMPQYYGDVSFDKIKPARRDYENIYEDSFGGNGGPRSYKSRDYIYDRDRKSFDRDSVESYESSNRRRKSFGSGDVYGSLESREEFRERYMGGPEKTRSLRMGMKMRVPTAGVGSNMVVGDDYDQNSENELQSRRVVSLDSRSLQRPNQRMRKSSGSSPWDGEEPPPPGHGQKGWKRPSSASESERRLAESRRALGNTPSGSDGEKDRRFRKKPRSRSGKELPQSEARQTQRYGSQRENYDYINYDEYEQPTDEDKFERLNRRRHEMHQRIMESERRQQVPTSDKYSYDDEDETPRYMAKKETTFYSDKVVPPKHEVFDEPVGPKSMKHPRGGADFDFDDFEDTPRSNTSSKFNFEEHGFESDFNSPPPASYNSASTTTPATKSSFRFSNDFSDKEKQIAGSLHSVTTFDSEFSPAPPAVSTSNSNTNTTQKLRFDDRVTISKFDNDQPSIGGGSAGCCDDAFEDDFSKSEFDFEKEDQWNPEPPKKNNLRLNSKLQQRQELIKKSESINIFAKKSEDPFEDDEFFKSPPPGSNGGVHNKTTNGGSTNGGPKDANSFQWESNFAKFDENM